MRGISTRKVVLYERLYTVYTAYELPCDAYAVGD